MPKDEICKLMSKTADIIPNISQITDELKINLYVSAYNCYNRKYIKSNKK
jgi:hypothetical protein